MNANSEYNCQNDIRNESKNIRNGLIVRISEFIWGFAKIILKLGNEV